jgi:transposase-like protein
MTQHFLLSAAAKTLSLASVARMTEEEAREAFAAIRWADNQGKPYCPKCGCVSVYACPSRAIFKCKGCAAQFSVTSGTIFANRKLAVREYLLAIAIFCNGAKGISALQLSRDLSVQYRTAYVLAHKLRETMAAQMNGAKVSGDVEIDGAYFGGHVRPTNWKKNRRDRRLRFNRSPKRRVVVIMRERKGRTLPFVFKAEDQAIPTIENHVVPGSTIYADEAGSWNALHSRYLTKRINHQEAYSDGQACTNQAESFFSRMRRAEIGTHHHFAGPYLASYADEFAWREDNRRISNGEQFLMVAGGAAKLPVSRKWSGYWNRKPKVEAAE